jgi:hypothetical protein
MKQLSHPVRFSAIALCIAIPLTAALAQAGTHMVLFVGGKSASADVRVIDGNAYVRLSDIAAALHATLAKQGGNYAMVPNGHTTPDAAGKKAVGGDAPGGANQVEGRRGEVGDLLMTGKYRFQVIDVKEVATYTQHYSPDAAVVEPKGDGDKLILINCLVKNARNEKHALNVYDTNTALTDEDGQSFPPVKYDVRWHVSFHEMCSEEMLPGASVKFAVLFSVPKDAKLKDLVFTLADLNEKGNDVRINLAK